MIIVTGDRDSYQLVRDPDVMVLYNKRGVSDYAFYDEAGIAERTGVTPALYPQYAALRGDTSDNLPGVPGVGEKTAAKWVREFGSLAELVDRVDEVKGKAGESLRAADPGTTLMAMNRIIDVESWAAMCTPWLALVAPGPRVTKQMPGRPVSLP